MKMRNTLVAVVLFGLASVAFAGNDKDKEQEVSNTETEFSVGDVFASTVGNNEPPCETMQNKIRNHLCEVEEK